LKVGGACGIGLFCHVSYDTWRSWDSYRFAESGVADLDNGALQSLGNHSFALGRFLRCCSVFSLGDHFERGILFLLMG